jgi:hypothetical protein
MSILVTNFNQAWVSGGEGGQKVLYRPSADVFAVGQRQKNQSFNHGIWLHPT